MNSAENVEEASPVLVIVTREEEDWNVIRGMLIGIPVARAFDIFNCWSGGDAVDLLESRRPDIVVADEDLRDGSGLQVLEAVARRAPAARRILWTRQTSNVLSGRSRATATAAARWATALWEKNWPIEHLRLRLELALEAVADGRARRSAGSVDEVIPAEA